MTRRISVLSGLAIRVCLKAFLAVKGHNDVDIIR